MTLFEPQSNAGIKDDKEISNESKKKLWWSINPYELLYTVNNYILNTFLDCTNAPRECFIGSSKLEY